MGRMLEALKRTAEPNAFPEPVLAVANPEPVAEEPAEEEMPFIEVGGPRKPQDRGGKFPTCPQDSGQIGNLPLQTGNSKTRLEMPAPRPASLQVRAPQSVALQCCPQPVPAHPRVAAELVTFHQPEHPVSQQYAALFAQLPAAPADGAAAALVFTSLAPGAGTTTSLLNLAVAACRKHNKRTCVVDANYRRPAAAARLGVTAAIGLHDVLGGKVALEQALQATPIDHLHVLPAGIATESVPASADAIRWVLAWLRQRFDLILVDAPAWDGGDGLRALLPAATAVYLVVDATETEKPEVRVVTREVARLGSRLGGLIVAQ